MGGGVGEKESEKRELREGEGSSQGKCTKYPWTKTTGGRIGCGRWGPCKSGESNGGKKGTIITEQQ